MSDKFYYKGDKPVYYNDCAAHANVYVVYEKRPGGVDMCGPVCDADHKVTKLMAKTVPLMEFLTEWKEVGK